jgi:hypothetical protein
VVATEKNVVGWCVIFVDPDEELEPPVLYEVLGICGQPHVLHSQRSISYQDISQRNSSISLVQYTFCERLKEVIVFEQKSFQGIDHVDMKLRLQLFVVAT